MAETLKPLVIATLVAMIFLLMVNAILFPLVFPEGPPEKFENLREAPIFLGHIAALFLTSALMAYIYSIIAAKNERSWRTGAKVGALAALFVSLPHNLHIFAMVDLSFLTAMKPVLWILMTWSVTGMLIGLVYKFCAGKIVPRIAQQV